MSSHRFQPFTLQTNDNAPSDPTQVKTVQTSVYKMPAWSDAEDRALLSVYGNTRPKYAQGPGLDLEDDTTWDHVAIAMYPRSAVQCLLRYIKLTSANRVSGIDCNAAPPPPVDKKRDYEKTSPSSASTGSGSSLKKFKHDEVTNDWTEEETDLLAEVMMQYQDNSTTPDWDSIADNFPGKSPIDCLTQWQNISLPDQVKGKGSWTPTEDAILRDKRSTYGRKWSKIAEYLPGRSGKQCRERYINHLNPNLKRGEWTDDEEAVLIAMHEHNGNKWTLISKQLPGRSDNDVKNHYHSTIKRKFDLHGKEKLVNAAIQQVFMLVDAGRLGQDVVKDWKPNPLNAPPPTHPVDAAPEAAIAPAGGHFVAPHHADPYRAIPHPHDRAAGLPLFNMYDHLPYPPPPPPHGVPNSAYTAPLFHGHLPVGIVDPLIPPFPYHTTEPHESVHHAHQTDLSYRHEN